MPEEVKRKRGRPQKQKPIEQQVVELNLQSSTVQNNNYEFSSCVTTSSLNLDSLLFSCGLYNYFSKSAIDCVIRDPVTYHDEAIRLSDLVYTKNGIVSNSIDYMTALPCLDRVITIKSKRSAKKIKENKEKMSATLKTIDDKLFIRDALHTEMREGIAFYYFDIRKPSNDFQQSMSDYDVENIVEINELGINARIVTLPWQYTKIVGKKNGRYVLAFNLRYFDDFTGDTQERKLKKYPKEISDGYNKKRKGLIKDWLILDSDKTMCRKIKCKDSEPWGRSLIIAALEDVLYKDYYTDTKRNVLDEINNKIIYETFPEGKDKGTCALSKKQQEDQHNTVKQAIMTKNSKGGTSFFSVAAGTKLDSIDIDLDIFDSKNESDLNNNISLDLGICASLIGAMSTGNFASGQSNLEMITAQLYTWVYEWQTELNYVINKNIIKDDKNKVEIYYFPTSFVNRKTFFDQMKTLYSEASGSLTFLVASAGIDPDVYFNILDQEIEDGIYEKYKPHQTSWTMSAKEEDSTNLGGRPTVDNPTNENTIISKSNNANDLPSPSDNK